MRYSASGCRCMKIHFDIYIHIIRNQQDIMMQKLNWGKINLIKILWEFPPALNQLDKHLYIILIGVSCNMVKHGNRMREI